MLSIAKGLLEEEEREREEERTRYMAENCPPVSMPRSMQELQVLPGLNAQLRVQYDTGDYLLYLFLHRTCSVFSSASSWLL